MIAFARTHRISTFPAPLAALRAALACAALLLAPAAGGQGLTVSPIGTASYTYPIATPPGIAGVVPQLSLSYSGRSVNGPVGIGWSLQGTSVITRCHGQLAVDGAHRSGVANGPTDKLCLDGERLIQVDANGVIANFPQTADAEGLGAGSREYRTEKDSFSRIRAYGVANGSPANGPAYFKVWTKDGRIHEYGTHTNAAANATVTAVGDPVVIAWALSRTSDLRGNYIDYQYSQREVAWGSGKTTPTPGREWNLMEVRYTGTATKPPFAKVVFNYEDRPVAPAGQAHDRSEAYVLGAKHVSVRRLATVQTFANIDTSALKAKTYKLSYDNGPASNRSRLKQIAECAGATDTVCLPPTKFEYESGGTLAYQPSPVFKNSALATTVFHSTPPAQPANIGDAPPVKYGLLTADFNGDGKTDLIRWSDIPAQNRLYLSTGDGGFAAAPAFNITDQNLLKSDNCYSVRIADFDGDGLVDILRHRRETGEYQHYGLGSHPCPAGSTQIYFSRGDGSFIPKPVTGVTLHQSLSIPTKEESNNGDPTGDKYGWTRGVTYYILDLNGDGRLDVVTTLLPFQPLSLTEPENPCANQVCTRVFLGDGQGDFKEKTDTNVANVTLYAAPDGGYAAGAPTSSLGQPTRIVDLDGDGLPDIIGAGAFGDEHPARKFRSRGDGNFDLDQFGACDQTMDFNGDGRSDCITGHQTANFLYVADGRHAWRHVDTNLPYPLREQVMIRGQSVPSAHSVVADLDGDGRQDLLRWHDDPTKNAAFLSAGDGTFSAASSFNLKTSEHRLQSSDGSVAFVVGDFTGRGHVEVLRLMAAPASGDATANQLYVRAADARQPDLLKEVISPTGARSTLMWVPMANSGLGLPDERYKSDRGTAHAAVFPNFEPAPSGHIVASLASDSGVGAGRAVSQYFYQGIKARHDGRGSLGVREFREQRPGANGSPLTRVTRSLQTHPYIGATSVSETWTGAFDQVNRLIARTATIHCDKTAAAGAEAAAAIGTPCPTTAKIVRPYVYKTVEETWDLDGTYLLPVSTITTTNSVNDTGDPTQTIVVTQGKVAGLSQTFTKTTTNLYKANQTSGDTWIIGGVERNTVQSTVPNSLGSIAAAAGTSPNATATSGSGATQVGEISDAAFHNVALGSSLTVSVTIRSSGVKPLAITAPGASSVSGTDFSFESTNCPASLPVGASCQVTVRFTPTVPAARAGTLTVATGGATLTSYLSGTGRGSSAQVLMHAAFGSHGYNQPVPNAEVRVRNTGNEPMALSVAAPGAPFALVSNGCASGIAPLASCTIVFSMASGTIGSLNGTVALSGASTGPVNASLNGTVTGSIAAFSSGDWSFTASYGAAAVQQSVQIRNDGNVAMTITGLSGVAAPFRVHANSCTAVAPLATCTIVIEMATSTIGQWPSNTATTVGATINLSRPVSGTVSGSVASIESGDFAFGGATLDTAARRRVNFRNTGNASMTLGLSGLAAPFSISDNTCNAVASQGTCWIELAMATSSIGSWGPQALSTTGASINVGLSASGSVSGSIATLTSTDPGPVLDFGTVAQGATAPWRGWSFRNDGNVPMTLTLGALNSPFRQSYHSCTNVQPGYICTIRAEMATASIGSNFSQSGIALTGAARGNRSDFGVRGAVVASDTRITSDSVANGINFGTLARCTEARRTMVVTNSGAVRANIQGYNFGSAESLRGSYSVYGGTCVSGGGVDPGRSCDVVIVFSSGGQNAPAGSHNTTFNVTGNFPTLTVNLMGGTSNSNGCM